MWAVPPEREGVLKGWEAKRRAPSPPPRLTPHHPPHSTPPHPPPPPPLGVVDVKGGKGSVELRRYPKSHPFAQLSGSDNIIAFTTARYRAQPLIIRGPGAGAEVTAGGVFSDLLRLAAYLGAPS